MSQRLIKLFLCEHLKHLSANRSASTRPTAPSIHIVPRDLMGRLHTRSWRMLTQKYKSLFRRTVLHLNILLDEWDPLGLGSNLCLQLWIKNRNQFKATAGCIQHIQPPTGCTASRNTPSNKHSLHLSFKGFKRDAGEDEVSCTLWEDGYLTVGSFQNIVFNPFLYIIVNSLLCFELYRFL